MGSLPSEQRMNVSILLALRNQSELTRLLSRLYDPSSPDYHQFLSVEQFAEEFAPAPEDYQAVVDFVRANGLTVTDAPANRMIVPVSGSVAQVEKAFNVRMNTYRHPTENRTFYSPDREPSLDLKVQVAHIAGLNNFSLPRPLVKAATTQSAVNSAVVGSGPGGSYLSSDMRAAYYGGTALTGSGQTVGLLQFDGYNISDVTSTFDGTATSSTNGNNYVLHYTPSPGGTSYSVPINNVPLDGTTGAPVSGDDSEEVLDIVQAIGMAPGLSQVRVYIGNSDVDILNAMASEHIAKQLSISWAWGPDDPTTDDVFFEEFAAQGQSVFAASGDYGAYSPSVPYYYPAEDAWVTAVGATSLTTNGAAGALTSEIAWDQSGGGISPDGIDIPNWQAGVATSLNGASTALRNVPDVAMEGDFDNFDCSMGSCAGTWAGTSFAAPRWAGFMALVNQQAAAAGDSAAGFINPWIYATAASPSYGSEFHDVDAGNNGYEPGYKFNSVPGYDLVTGWGSPAGQNLIDGMAPTTASVGFQLSTSASSLTLNPGSSGTTTIGVIDRGGFAGSVNLAVTSSLPSGVTASFSSNPTTQASVLTLIASVSAVSGSYLVTVTGTSGAHSATTYITVDTPTNAVTITSPVVPQVPVIASILKPGTPVPVQGTVLSNFQDVRLEWAPGINPASGWASTGMTVSAGLTSPVVNQKVGNWDTSSIVAANYYTIRLSADYAGATVSATTLVYLEPDLISTNWPKWLDATPFTYSGIVPIVVGSGNMKLAIVEPNYLVESAPPRYRVFSPDGSSDTSTSLVTGNYLTPAFGNLTSGDGGESLVADAQDVFVLNANNISNQMTAGAEDVWFNYSQVVLADLKGDSSLQALALGYQSWNNLAFLFAWGPIGQILNSNFPIQVPFQQGDVMANNPGFVVGDINGDGNQDIIVQETPSATTYTLKLFANDGTALPWAAPTFQGAPGQMILADLDGNGKLEVIVDVDNPNTGLHMLHVLGPDGTERSGWPFSLGSGFVYLAAGDLAQTGKQQIVVAAYNHLYVLNGNGTSFSNAWPLTKSAFSPFGPVTMADIDGDGYPEILVASGNLTFPQGSDEVTTISPSVSRLGDNSPLSVFVQTRNSESNSTPMYFAPVLQAFHHDGSVARSWNLQGMNGNQPYYTAHITVGDFNQDGKTEIAVETPLISGGTVDGWLVEGVMEVLTTGATYNAVANDWPMMYHDAHNSATSASANPLVSQVATPTFSVAPGTYTSTQTVTLSDATAGAAIYYTTNGTTPTTASTKYTSAIAVTSTETIIAIATAANDSNSAVASAAYVITPSAATPTFNIAPGTYTSTQTVTISDATAGATIYYTTNGTTPTTASAKYTTAIVVTSTETITAIATAANDSASTVASAAYVITLPAATPTFSVAPGTYNSSQNLVISDATAGAAIYYTTNGTLPTNASTRYAGAITVSSSETLKAIATATGDSTSAVASAVYVITPSAATPTFSVAPGTYTSTQSVTISDATAGATIYYTTNGTTPTTASARYSTAIVVTSTETITAIATATNDSASAVANAAYVITPPAATPSFSIAPGTYNSPQTVTISDASASAAAGAAIYYTTNGTTPTTASTRYTGAITVSSTETLKAIATATGDSTSAVATAAYVITPPAATPTFSVAPGTYTSTQSVTISDATAGATIYYTTNANVPTNASTRYTGAITVSSTETLKAIAVATGDSTSSVATAAYVITPPAATPIFSVAPGTYTSTQTVTIADATAGATIYFTTNANAPTNASTRYTGAITVSSTETLKSIAIATGDSASAVATAAYVIAPPAATPTFSVAPGTYTSTQTVTISDATAGAAIYYTTNGTIPTTSSSRYTGAITVSSTETLKAIAVATGDSTSSVATAAYVITPPAATPTFSVAPGTYTSPQTVTISDASASNAAAGATIYYTTNGTTPTTSSTRYTGAITVSSTETLKAIATAAGDSASAVATAAYVITPPAATPTFSVAPGTYNSSQTVTISDATAGATIYYTTNGTTPTTASAKYGVAIVVASTETIKAIATAANDSASAVASAAYSLKKPLRF